MDTIYLKFEGDGTAFNPHRACLVLGDQAMSANGDHYLSCDCRSLAEIEEQVAYLKKMLDKAATTAKRKFSK